MICGYETFSDGRWRYKKRRASKGGLVVMRRQQAFLRWHPARLGGVLSEVWARQGVRDVAGAFQLRASLKLERVGSAYMCVRGVCAAAPCGQQQHKCVGGRRHGGCMRTVAVGSTARERVRSRGAGSVTLEQLLEWSPCLPTRRGWLVVGASLGTDLCVECRIR